MEVIDHIILTCQGSEPKSSGTASDFPEGLKIGGHDPVSGGPAAAPRCTCRRDTVGTAPRPALRGTVAPECPRRRPLAVSQGLCLPLSPAGGGLGGSRSSLRLSLFFKELQLSEPLRRLPSGRGFWKSAQWLCGGPPPSRQRRIRCGNCGSWRPVLENAPRRLYSVRL